MAGKGPNSRVIIMSSLAAVLGIALTAAGLMGTSHRASAGDFDPSPQPTQVVPTEPISTAVSTQIVETPVATQPVSTEVPTTIIPTTVPTTIPTTIVNTTVPVTSTSAALIVASSTPVPPTAVSNVAGVQALPRTGRAASGGGLGWLFVASGICLALAGFAGIAYERRKF